MRTLLVLSVLALPAVGQEQILATEPLLRISCDGPSAFRQAFLATNVGGMLGADETAPLLKPVQETFLQSFGPLRETLWPLLRDYTGRAELLVYAWPSAANREVVPGAVLRLSSDGATDLDAMGEGLGQLLGGRGGARATLEVGDVERDVLLKDNEVLVLPYRQGEELWVVYAGNPDDALSRVVAAASKRPAPRRERGASPLELALDLQQTAKLAMHAEGDREEYWRIAEAIWGVSSVHTLTASLRPAGPQVLFEIQGTFDPEPRGIFRGFIPQVQVEPTLTHLVPPDCPAWKDGRFRTDQVVDSCIETMAHIFENGDRAKVNEGIEGELGLDLLGDLLVHMGDEVLVLGGPWDDEETDEERGGYNPFEGTCFVFKIAKPQPFAKNWPKLRDSLYDSLDITAQTQEIHGVGVVGGSSWLMDSSMYTALADDLGFMAFGDRGLTLMEQALARRKEEQGPLPPAVQRVRRQAPPGFNGAARADARAMFGGQVGIVKQVLQEILSEAGVPLEAEVMVEGLAPYAQLLSKHQLDRVVTLTGYADGTWTFRVLW